VIENAAMPSIVELFGIGLPIVQASMAGVQGSALAIAVSNAGGLGSLPCALLSPDAMRAELRAMKNGTERPFNVNFFCHTAPVPDGARETAWRRTLRPYYDELGVDPDAAANAAGRGAFSEETAEILREFEPAVVSFHFGLPSDPLLQRVRTWGAKVLSSATTVDEARWLEARGVDAIIAQGVEAGGHRGMFLSADVSTQVGTLALVPQIVKAVKVPVIAAGGIADAAGVAAALALGAAGVQVGTAYLLCPEATTSAVHRAALASVEARHTAVTNVFTGRPARAIVNRIVRELGPMNVEVPPFPLAAVAVLPLRAKAEAAGSGDFSPLWCGQNASGCRAIAAAELTRQLCGRATSPRFL
jgi:nitronate monooxygenase